MEFVANLRIATSFEGKIASSPRWDRGGGGGGGEEEKGSGSRCVKVREEGEISLVDDERRQKRSARDIRATMNESRY